MAYAFFGSTAPNPRRRILCIGWRSGRAGGANITSVVSSARKLSTADHCHRMWHSAKHHESSSANFRPPARSFIARLPLATKTKNCAPARTRGGTMAASGQVHCAKLNIVRGRDSVYIMSPMSLTFHGVTPRLSGHCNLSTRNYAAPRFRCILLRGFLGGCADFWDLVRRQSEHRRGLARAIHRNRHLYIPGDPRPAAPQPIENRRVDGLQ
jgi:hypothetical protein